MAANRAQRRRLERKGLVEVGERKETVCFANVNPGEITCELFGTFTHLLTHDMQTTHYIDGFICKRSGGLLSVFRNGVVAEYLQDVESDWIWMVDSDIVLAEDTLHLLMEARTAHPEAKIITGWYVIPMGEEGFRPDVYKWTGETNDWTEGGNFVYQEVPEDVCYIDSAGIGCTLVKRDLLIKMMKKYGRPSPWFTLCERGGPHHPNPRVFGEDHSFFLRARELGCKPLLVPQAEVGHMKTLMLTGEHLTTGVTHV